MAARNAPYTCPRCGYEISNKAKMRIHFGRKTPCPGVIDDLALTDHVKEYVLVNRIFRVKKEPEIITIENQHVTQINNYF